MNFELFYRSFEAPKITDALNKLFLKTCQAWYANHKPLQPLSLSTDYQSLYSYTPEKLERMLSRQIKYVPGKQRFYVLALNSDRTFVNPWRAIEGLPLTRTTCVCTTHGDFNQHNLLLDNEGNTWLIDFQQTGPSHILRDIAMLDSVIRFQLLKPEEATLEERLQLEKVLCSIKHFRQLSQLRDSFATANAALAKAFAVVLHLRGLAHHFVEQNQSNDDISEYSIALLFSALNTLQFFSLSADQRDHAMLSASLLAERIV
jgi:hypothetical protein